MKKTASALFAAILLAAAGLMLSCKSQGGTGDFNNAGGKPYEIVVSIDQELWNGEVGDTLRSILLEPVPMFNQVEPQFDISRVNPGALKDLILRHATSSSYSSIRKRPNLRPSHNTTYMPGRRLSSP